MYHFETFWRDLFNSNDHFTWIFLPGPWKQSIRKCTSGHDSHMKIGLELNTAVLDYYIPLVDGCNLKINFYFRLAENEGMSVIKISVNIYTVCPLRGSVFQTKPWDLVWIYISMYFTRIQNSGLSLFCPSPQTKLILFFIFFELDIWLCFLSKLCCEVSVFRSKIN